jgi:serine/threonine-protein kinase HipA
MRKESTLFVFTHLAGEFVPAGRLSLIEDGPDLIASEFAYGLKYLERGNAIEVDPVSLSITDKEAVRGKALLPSGNLAFFGGIRDAAPDAWGRRVIEAKLKVPANSLPESSYLLEAGSNRVGALDVRVALNGPEFQGQSSVADLQYLLEAAERIEAGEPVPARLGSIFDAGSALGGARPKATVRDETGLLWLAKFQSRNEVLNVPEIEMATLRLAHECGLSVPAVKTVEFGGRAVMLIRRFDRFWGGKNVLPARDEVLLESLPAAGLIEKRLAFFSGLTMLACDETDARQKNYGDLARAIRRYCHPEVIRDNNRELFARMVFNIFVTNDDDHLRNHGFVWDPALQGWRLSPLYDVMPRPAIASERQLFLGVGPMGRLATLDNALAAREMFSLSEREAGALIASVWAKVREWRVYFEQFGASAQSIDQAIKAFRHVDDISTPALRAKLP